MLMSIHKIHVIFAVRIQNKDTARPCLIIANDSNIPKICQLWKFFDYISVVFFPSLKFIIKYYINQVALDQGIAVHYI